MKNILILATVGGFLEKFERANVELLQEMGYGVHYAANLKEPHYPFDEDKLRERGVRLHHIDIARSPFLFRANVRAFRQLSGIVRENDICAVHCHTPVGGVLGRLLGVRFLGRKLKVVYTAHGFHFYKGAPVINKTIYYLIERALAHATDLLVVINKEDYESGRRFRLKKDGKIFRIPGVGIDLKRFAPLNEKERESAREKLGIGSEDFFLVSVGELNENKNQGMILQALAEMRLRGKDISHIKYGVCGDGFYRERLEKQIQQLYLEHTVCLYGYRTDAAAVLGCADASVFPSFREGLGMAGIEALAMGVPLLASNNRGTREYLRHGKNGYVCRADDAAGWIRGIERLRSLSGSELSEMKQFCRKSVRPFGKEYTRAVMRAVYEELDKKLEGRYL